MDTKIIRTLLKKEMLDVFRDKKTVIMMLIVPVLLYPIVFIGAMQVMASNEGRHLTLSQQCSAKPKGWRQIQGLLYTCLVDGAG